VTKVQLDLSEGRSYDVQLGEVIDHGGEARVHDIVGLNNYCAKIYRRPENRSVSEERLGILSRFGLGTWHVDGHPEIAFPIGLCRDTSGNCIGFAMHKLSWPPYVPLHKVLQPSAALRKNGFLTWEHCVLFATDLARMVGKLHGTGVVVGDLCPDNVFVSLANARVTLIDVDSFQVRGPDGARHKARMQRSDYSAPELTNQPAGTWRSPLSDLTPLGIVIAQILLDQIHPFSGYPLADDPPDGDDLDAYCIAAGLSWITSPSLVAPPKNAPIAARILPPALIKLMTRCFSLGASEPQQRPSPNEWVRQLTTLAAGLQTCTANPRHRFRNGSADCPWCERACNLGRDPFPEPAQPVRMPIPWLIKPEKAEIHKIVHDDRAWGTIEALKESDEPVKGTVIEVVKGGLILDIGLRGFLPASLVEMRRVRDLQPYVGRELEAKIIELDKNRNNVVLSRRAWLEQTQSEVRSEFLNQLQRGQVRKGVVSSIVNFGAFVDLGGVDGLVHVSELSWKHIDHPSEVVEVGQEVTVEVLDVDMERERVSLSLKATQEDPWRQFARTHAIGQIVPGKVTKLVPFGAFVRVDEGIEGLVHISELAERHVEIPEQVVQVGNDVMVKVIDIDLERRRISLSLKQANEGFTADTEFDPTQYGMAAEYDNEGNYIYPEGFDPDTQEWQEGFDKQREEWERQYAEAHERYEQHMTQVKKAAEAEAAAEVEGAGADVEGGGGGTEREYSSAGADKQKSGGTLASDEQLAALREKLSGGV